MRGACASNCPILMSRLDGLRKAVRAMKAGYPSITCRTWISAPGIDLRTLFRRSGGHHYGRFAPRQADRRLRRPPHHPPGGVGI